MASPRSSLGAAIHRCRCGDLEAVRRRFECCGCWVARTRSRRRGATAHRRRGGAAITKRDGPGCRVLCGDRPGPLRRLGGEPALEQAAVGCEVPSDCPTDPDPTSAAVQYRQTPEELEYIREGVAQPESQPAGSSKRPRPSWVAIQGAALEATRRRTGKSSTRPCGSASGHRRIPQPLRRGDQASPDVEASGDRTLQ